MRVGSLVKMSPNVGDVLNRDHPFCGLIFDIERGFYKRKGSPSSDRVHVLWCNGEISACPCVCVLDINQEND
jgi:hypothetical protein